MVVCNYSQKKLRQDANLKYLYKGPKRKGRGRPKKHDGKVDTKNIDKWRFKEIFRDETVILFQAIVWSVSLKRNINVVYAEFLDEGQPTKRYALLFSTDLELDGIFIYKFYKGRFQIEFLLIIDKSVAYYNSRLPHSSVDYLTPEDAHHRKGHLKKHWTYYWRAAQDESVEINAYTPI